ncbi:MAG: SPOR domain-containing protein [Desulfarculaceae bacterium]|nr:SPOR domain-containing protein [Desulfarculaceae bacterium]MCF8048030.1 SPOR domain-containing protein [Desulfarculaceae bacterium]MCF8123641.1 SPOR domain-containing protein [Desulfarculaceae bacterium]
MYRCWGILAAILLLTAACASGPSKEQAEPAPAPAAPLAKDASAQPAPSWARMPTKPPGDATRVCLWVFWTRNKQVMQEMQAMLKGGRPFQSASLDMVRNNKEFATTHADCLAKSDLPQPMLQAIKGLKLGQVTAVFKLNDGTALAMLTSDVFRRQAQKLYQQGKYSQAMQPLGLDLELHPAAAGSWHLMALCRAAVGNKKGALKAYDRALEWTPNDPAVLNDKAALLNSMGDGGQAVVLFRRALDQAPDNPVYMNNLAWALAQNTKELGEAMSLAKKAVGLAPGNPAVWDTLGMVQQAKGDDAAAVVSFHHALRLDPNAAGAKSRMTASLLKLSPDKLSRLGAGGVKLPPASAPKPTPAPPAKPEPEPQPILEAKPVPKPEPPAKVAATGWSQRPAPEPPAKEEPLPAPVPPAAAALAPKPEPKPIPAPKPRPAPAMKAKPKPMAPPAQQEGAPPVGWYLQLSSNRNPNLAKQARDRWRSAGHSAYVWDWTSRKSGLWHRVLIGPYPGKSKALAAGRKFKADGKLSGYVLVRVR